MKIVKLFRQTLQKMLYINCVEIHSNHCILEIVSYARYQIAKPKMFCKKKQKKSTEKMSENYSNNPKLCRATYIQNPI